MGSLTALVRPHLQAQMHPHLDFPRTRARALQTMVSCPQQKAAESPEPQGSPPWLSVTGGLTSCSVSALSFFFQECMGILRDWENICKSLTKLSWSYAGSTQKTIAVASLFLIIKHPGLSKYELINKLLSLASPSFFSFFLLSPKIWEFRIFYSHSLTPITSECCIFY